MCGQPAEENGSEQWEVSGEKNEEIDDVQQQNLIENYQQESCYCMLCVHVFKKVLQHTA